MTELISDYELSLKSPFKPGAVLLHPFPRSGGVAQELDETEYNWYFTQARGGVFVRMAIFNALINPF